MWENYLTYAQNAGQTDGEKIVRRISMAGHRFLSLIVSITVAVSACLLACLFTPSAPSPSVHLSVLYPLSLALTDMFDGRKITIYS